MQKKLLSTTALLIAAGIAAPSFAQWTISAGVQSTNMSVNSDMRLHDVNRGGFFPAGSEAEAVETDANTGVGGELAIGYQFNYNSVYNVALEVFGQLSDADVVVPVYVGDGDFYSDNHATVENNWIAGLRLRPGYNVTKSTRLFIDGGIVWGEFDVRYSDGLQSTALGGPGIQGTNDDDTLVGWRYGAGVEHKFTPNFAMGVDYTVTEFEALQATKAEDALAIDNVSTASLDYTPTLNTLGLNFKYLFGAKKKQKRQYQMVDK